MGLCGVGILDEIKAKLHLCSSLDVLWELKRRLGLIISPVPVDAVLGFRLSSRIGASGIAAGSRPSGNLSAGWFGISVVARSLRSRSESAGNGLIFAYTFIC